MTSGLQTLDADGVAAVRAWFPERPGPIVHAHVSMTGHGRCRVDRWPHPRLVLADVASNIALRGDPDRAAAALIGDLEGFVEAAPDWLPVLRAVDPGMATWGRIIAALPTEVDLPSPTRSVRRLTAADAAALARLDPSIAWIAGTWGGPAGLAASGHAWAAFADHEVVSVAASFLVSERYEDLGVVTDPDHRGRGLATACTAALAGDVRRRGRQPTWTTSPDNAGSRGVAGELGFEPVRDDVLYVVNAPIPA